MQVRLFTGWFWNAELRLSVSYRPGVNTGFGSISGTEVCGRAELDAKNIAQTPRTSTRDCALAASDQAVAPPAKPTNSPRRIEAPVTSPSPRRIGNQACGGPGVCNCRLWPMLLKKDLKGGSE